MNDDQLMGLQEIAELLEVKQQTARMWRYRKRLPDPAADLSMGPVWYRSQIVVWARETGRWPSG